MMSLQSIDISGFKSGVQKNKKPFLILQDAFVDLQNAYIFREELKKREGIKLIGRFRRVFNDINIGNSTAGTWSFNIYTVAGIVPEATAEIDPGSVRIYINPVISTGAITGYTRSSNAEFFAPANGLTTGDRVTVSGVTIVPDTGTDSANGEWSNIEALANSFKIGVDSHAWGKYLAGGTWTKFGGLELIDQGNGLLATDPVTVGNYGYINYLTGDIVITHTGGAVISYADFAYFPTLPAMGIQTRDLPGINDEETLWFDTKYCYKHDGSDFQEFIPGVTWDGTNSDFFWATNYRGIEPQTRLYFVTNFVATSGSPMRYTDGITWSTFAPAISSTQFLFSARILIPYYGRLLAFNTIEGTAIGSVVNIFNRCRFSQIGSPIEVGSWRSDQFGKGGFVDAPTNEAIVSVTFYKNTLIVDFERSTWRLQYLGEYGLPFIWERISSDYGSESTFSPVLFDSGVLAVGDKAITGSSGGDVQRIDLDIPDLVYDFLNTIEGPKRVHGIRDFKKELVYWCYPDYTTLQQNQFYPNKSLLYNYRNNTFAFYRNTVTCFGNFQYPAGVTWDRLDVFWDNMNVTWDNSDQKLGPLVVSANQHGFAHFYGYNDVETQSDSTIDAIDQESLSVTAFNIVDGLRQLTIKDHNLLTNEWIYLTGMNFVVTASKTAGSTTLNDQIYLVRVEDQDTITLAKWNYAEDSEYEDFDVTNVGTYVGGGVVALFPNIRIETKDFNPMRDSAGFNIKTSYIDFLFDVSSPSPINVLMQMNATPNADGNNTEGNLLIGNTQVETANSKTGFITGIIQGVSPICIITSKNHGLLNGDEITFGDIVGSTELNSGSYVVTFISTNTFSVIQVVSNYISGGYWKQDLQQYFTLSSQYSWHRFFASCFGQYLRLVLQYSDGQMSQISTHRQNFVLNAMKIWYRPGGRNIFGK